MASRKTYETLFMLSARLSPEFRQAYGEAEGIVTQLDLAQAEAAQREMDAAARSAVAYNMIADAARSAASSVISVYTDITETYMEFDYSMSAVRAISGATGDEMEDLTEKAHVLGETTVYTATQSAEAMKFLAQAGWETEEMLAGIDGDILLAAASGTDLARASEIIADTLAGFRMEAGETARMADVLAKTAASSNTNVEYLGSTFQYVASIAGALGFSIEDVSTMLGLMANAGVKGTKAGTALKGILNGLASDATFTGEAFGEMTLSMFNEDGSTKSLKQVIDELRTIFGMMTGQEQFVAAKSLAGLRGYNGLLAILNATNEQYDEMYANITDCAGAAEEMARIRLDNLQGDVTLYNSALEGLKDTIGEVNDGMNRTAVQGATDFIRWLNDVAKSSPGLIKVFDALGGFIVTAAGALAAISAVKGLIALLGAIGVSLTGPVGWITLAAGALGALTVAMIDASSAEKELTENGKLIQKYKDLSEQLEEVNIQAGATREWSTSTEKLIQEYNRLSSVENRSVQDKLELKNVVDALNEAIPGLGLSYDYLSDSISGATVSLEAWYRAAKAEKDRETLQERFTTLSDQKKTMEEYLGNATAILDDYNENGVVLPQKVLSNLSSQARKTVQQGGARDVNLTYQKLVAETKERWFENAKYNVGAATEQLKYLERALAIASEAYDATFGNDNAVGAKAPSGEGENGGMNVNGDINIYVNEAAEASELDNLIYQVAGGDLYGGY